MCDDGQAADNQILDLSLIERLNDGLNAGFFHAGTRHTGTGFGCHRL
jgi:hypothetical protein